MAGKPERPNGFQRSQCDVSGNCELIIPPYVSIRSTNCATQIPIISQEENREELFVDTCARVDTKLYTSERRICRQNVFLRDPKYSESVFIGHDELCSCATENSDMCGNFDRMHIGGGLNSRRIANEEISEADGEGMVCRNVFKMHGNFQCNCICKNQLMVHRCRPREVERVEKHAACLPNRSPASLDFVNVPIMPGQNTCLRNSIHSNIHEDKTVLGNSLCSKCYVKTIDKYHPTHWEQCTCKDCASRVFASSNASCAQSVTNANAENKTHLYVDCLSSNTICSNDPASKHLVLKTGHAGYGQSPPAQLENQISTHSTNCAQFKKLDNILLQKACSKPVNRPNVQVAQIIPSMSSAVSNEDERNFQKYSRVLYSNLSLQPEHKDNDTPLVIVNVPLDEKETAMRPQTYFQNVECSAVDETIPEILSKSAKSLFDIKNDYHQVQCKRSSNFVVNFEVAQSQDYFAGTCHDLFFHENKEYEPRFDNCSGSEVNSAFYSSYHISRPTEERSMECSELKGINSNKNCFSGSATHLSKDIDLSNNLEQGNTRKLPPPYSENPGGITVHFQTHGQTSNQFHQNLLLSSASNNKQENAFTDPATVNTTDFSSDLSADEESSILSVSDTSLPKPKREQMMSLKKERVRYYPAYFKLYMEQHIENVLKSYHQRLKRRQQLEEEMEKLNLPEIDRKQCRSWLFQKESQYNRLKRTQMSLSHFETITVLGRGAFGDVSLIRRRDSGVLYAMKTLKKKDVLRQKQIGHVKAERDLLAEVDSEWVVKLYYSFQDSESLYFVMEYVAGGDLMGLLVKMKIFTHQMAQFYTAELILAVESVHRLGYIHRDIKPDNVLIGLDGHVKLTDFGLCTGFHRTHASESYIPEKSEESNCEQKSQNHRSTARSLVGTPNYIAPEVLLQTGYDSCCDWWSVGIIVFEMLIGHPPFMSDSSLETQLKVIHWQSTLRIPDAANLSGDETDLILGLLCDQNHRLGRDGAHQIKCHPFFDGIDFVSIHRQTAPYVPQIAHPLDTSNFEAVEPLRTIKKDDEENFASCDTYDDAKHAFLDFTFRRFFDDAVEKFSESLI